MTDLLPTFSTIDPAHIENQLDEWLNQARDTIQQLTQINDVNWSSISYPLQTINNSINNFFSPISHLNAVTDNKDLRAAYEACLPKLSAFYTELEQNEALFGQLSTLQSSPLTDLQRRWVELQLKNRKLSGVNLPAEDKETFKAIQMQLSTLGQTFNNHVIDDTTAFELPITDESVLLGLPDAVKTQCKQKAEAKGQEGYLLGIDQPSVHAVMSYAENRELRKQIYFASSTKASDQSHGNKAFDNSATMVSILELKLKASKLLGFNNYAENSLASKMAENVDEVTAFLNDLAEKSKPFAIKEMAQLKTFARDQLEIEKIEAWDINFIAEKYREKTYSLSEEAFRQYFTIDDVLAGFFTLMHELFAVEFKEITAFDTYHKDVRLFQLIKGGEIIAHCYLDLYAREGKKPGAWMSNAQNRFEFADGNLQRPIAFLTMNFRAGTKDQAAKLSHQEITTLFHEFGHGVHHMLTQISIDGIAGIDGVEWDAVELPSQLLENWCYEPEVLKNLSNQRLPDEMIKALLDARAFHQGYMMLRQLEFALFDIQLHALTQAPSSDEIQALLDNVRKAVTVIQPPAENRFQHSFSHIFAGGYAAGYYSYKWAEVLSSDVYSAFEETSIYDKATGQRFYDTILSQGASKPMKDAFFAFRGRKPDTSALLRHAGLV
ncbi:MAG: M3 family metallopeptidase [Cellvibrionales bacterium]|nr:M3 family metallopeptidase [Cellvibrionales bacterium]